MDRLESAIADFERDADFDFVDPRRLAAVIDRLQGTLCAVLDRARKRGDHLLTGQTPVSWAAETCRLSRSSASDRLCVGEQLREMPRIAAALSSGELGYQAAGVICHLAEQLGEKSEQIQEEDWVGYAGRFSVKELRYLALRARQAWDAEGFDRDAEEDYAQRYLHLSELGGMYKLDAVLDQAGGAALQSALLALAGPLGAEDMRTPRQRRADALVELVHHAMDQGTLPSRQGVRPHISLNTTLEGLNAELEDGRPISVRTLQRLACDATLHRVVKAGSVVVDVGRATRSVSPAQWRALKARHRTCAGPGCDRPVGWTNPHHVEFWSRGGKTNLKNLVPLCHHHHRLVHEGGWQVIRAGDRVEFVAPERPVPVRARAPGYRWAA